MKRIILFISILTQYLYAQSTELLPWVEISTQTVNFDNEDHIKFEIEAMSAAFYINSPGNTWLVATGIHSPVLSSEEITGNYTTLDKGFQVYPKNDQWEPFWHALNKITIYIEDWDEEVPTYPWSPIAYFYIDYRDCRFRSGGLTNDITIRYDNNNPGYIYFAPGLLQGNMFYNHDNSIISGSTINYWEVVGYSGHEVDCFLSPVELTLSNLNNRPYLSWTNPNEISGTYTYDIYRKLGPPDWILVASNLTVTSFSDNELRILENPDLLVYYKVRLRYDLHHIIDSPAQSIYYNCLYKKNYKEHSNITEYSLISVFPNPFNPSTNISFSLQKTSPVKLRVFDSIGREIVTLVDEVKSAGNYTVPFDGKNLPSGVYFYTITAGEFSSTGKMLLTK